MSFRLSRATLDRPKQTIHACELLHTYAPDVVRACVEAPADHVVVAAVDRTEMVFAGIWEIPTNEIAQRVPQLENGGWAFIFSPGTSLEDVEHCALRTARLAFGRWEAMQRWASRQR